MSTDAPPRGSLGRDPVSRKEYLGVIDPSTGLVHPKVMEPDELGRVLTDGQFRCLDYGNVLIAHRAAENLGLDRILSDIFGKDAGIILAASICEAVDPCPIDGIPAVADRLNPGDVIGVGTRLTRNSLSKAVDGIGVVNALDGIPQMIQSLIPADVGSVSIATGVGYRLTWIAVIIMLVDLSEIWSRVHGRRSRGIGISKDSVSLNIIWSS